MDYPDYEIIVALDRCSDGSEQYLKSIISPKLHHMVIHQKPDTYNGKKYALEKAIDAAHHEWLLLTDADCRPASKNWIQTFARNATPETALILGISPYDDLPGMISKITEYETFQTAIHYASAALQNKAYMGVGRNIAYRKSTFLSVGGFAPFQQITGGDDDLLVQKISHPGNTRVNFEADSLTYSSPHRTWSGYLQQKTRHLSVGRYYQKKAKIRHTIRVLVHVMLWLSFLYLLVFFPSPARIIVLFGLLVLVKGLFFKKIASQLKLPFHSVWFPLLDVIYAIFLPLLGVRAPVVKKIRWK